MILEKDATGRRELETETFCCCCCSLTFATAVFASVNKFPRGSPISLTAEVILRDKDGLLVDDDESFFVADPFSAEVPSPSIGTTFGPATLFLIGLLDLR
jgi:hypothetical protein